MISTSYATYLALGATILMWSSAYIAIRVGIAEYTSGAFALLRLGIAALCMLTIYFFKPPKQTIARKDMVYAALLGAIGMGAYHIFLNLGEQTVTAGIASFLIAQAPVFTTLFAAFIFKEKIRKVAWAGLLISVLGIALIATSQLKQLQLNLGIAYILVSTVALSMYLIFAKKLISRMGSLYLTVFAVLGGALSLLIFLPDLIRNLGSASTSATWSAVYLGVFPTALAYLTYNYALSKLSRSTAASWLYTMPLATSAMGWLALSELPTILAFAGGLVALSGTVLVNWAASRE